MRSSVLVLLALLLTAACAHAACPEPTPPGAPIPKWFRRPLPGALGKWFTYDGISPFIPQAIKVQGSSMKFPLVGRGAENPLKGDPFGAGMRISTRYAYRGGKLCATVAIPKPTSGTIFAMYLIDTHPRGSERGGFKWREADLEWLGSKPGQVQTSMFEMGQEQPRAQDHDLSALVGGSQRDPIRYCILWDLLPAHKKFVRFVALNTARPGAKWVTIREWSPPNAEVDAFWNEPLRAIFTFWSNRHIAHWSGPYSLPAGEMLWVDVRDVAFVPSGPAYCAKPDLDLQPSTQ